MASFGNEIGLATQGIEILHSSVNGTQDSLLDQPMTIIQNDSITGLDGANGIQNGTPSAVSLKRKRNDVFNQHISLRPDAPRLPKFAASPYASSQTGLIYDVRMRFHVESLPTESDLHPEDPRRIHAIYEAFIAAGLAWRPGSDSPNPEWYMARIDTRPVTEEEVCLVHTKKHWDWVQSLKMKTPEQLQVEMQHEDQLRMDSVYLSPNTPYCAALSAGGAIEACRAILNGQVRNVFAVIRPPGHHAEREDAKGFCFFDNVSIATKVCLQEYPDTCRRVLILDWDVHHGNGVQEAHYDNPNVLYISLHVHMQGTFYPEGSYRDNRAPYGTHLHCGAGDGLGKNVNIPWTHFGMGDADYLYAFQQIVMPIGLEFNPDLVIIAAGFDAAEGDMLGGCHVTPAGYAHMTHMLMSLADGKVAVCLEGGYNLDSISKSSTAVAKTLMGEQPPRLEELDITSTGLKDVKKVLREQSKYWDSLYPKHALDHVAASASGIRLHDIVRQWQATRLFEEHQMSELYITREQQSRSFESQVLATPNYAEARPLLVLLHDPPEIVASPDLVTGKLECHNTWLVDAIKSYIDTAIANGFAVIDVNIPKHIASEEDSQEYENSIETTDSSSQATQLLTYVFDNYIAPSDATNVFLLGTDIGHVAITNFIKANEEAAVENISRTIHFVQNISLQTVRSATSDELTPWYHKNSLVFLLASHNFWSTEFARKPKKKFGNLRSSAEDTIGDMLTEHKEEVFDMLLEDTAEWRSENQHMPKSVEGNDMEDMLSSPITTKLPPVSNFAFSTTPKTTISAILE